MPKPKKQTREERLRKKRLAEKRTYERIKNNEDLWKEKQEKNKQSYIRRKQEKKQLSIEEMNPRQQRLQRKKWRKNFKSYYQKKKQERRTADLLKENTPPESPVMFDLQQLPMQDPLQIPSPSPPANLIKNSVPLSPGPSRILRSVTGNSGVCNDFDLLQSQSIEISSPACVSTDVRRIRYKKDKEISQLKQIILKLKKKTHSYQKQIQRMKNQESKKIEQVISSPSRRASKIKGMARKSNKPNKNSITKMPDQLKKDVEVFYEDDENSRICSGKKEFIVRNKVRKQKRFLNDTLINLHQKFLKISSFTISYAAFCKLRPFWVLSPDSRARDTCLCKLHTNMDLIVHGLYQSKIIPVKSSQDLLCLLCCNMFDVNCLQRNCSVCKDKVVPYQEFNNSIEVIFWQWETKQEIIQSTKRKIRTTEKMTLKMEPLKCIEKMDNILQKYFLHCANIVAQQKAFKDLKEYLQNDECIIHVDFSENYAVKCNEEIQSYHFGGSRKQITLHTSVIYFLDTDKKQSIQSFCTVSECLRHDISAVWAHIVPILEYIAEVKTNLTTLHFISDSPSSQYHNKKIFYMIASLNIYLHSVKTITWNYSEAGHGKGAPDGIGAVLKRTADRAVSQGQDITDLDDFLKIMDYNLKSIKLKTVSEYEVCEKDLLFPQNIKNFVGCMKMHQIVWNADYDIMAVRQFSCTENICLYKPIKCKHKKHLGFFTLSDMPQNNAIHVTPLCDSPRILREIGTSFWTERTPVLINNTDNFGENNQGLTREIEKGKEMGKKSNTTTTKIQESIGKGPKGKGIGKKSKANKEMVVNDSNNPKKNSNDFCFMKGADKQFSQVMHDKTTKQNVPYLEELKTQRDTNKQVTSTGQSSNEPAKFLTRYTEKSNYDQEQTTDIAIDLDDVSLYKDVNKNFNISLENLDPYVLDDDDDEEFNIF